MTIRFDAFRSKATTCFMLHGRLAHPTPEQRRGLGGTVRVGVAVHHDDQVWTSQLPGVTGQQPDVRGADAVLGRPWRQAEAGGERLRPRGRSRAVA